jgi:HEAT repeat protein
VDAKEIEALFAQTLVGDYEGEDGWKAVAALRQDGNRAVFDYAAAWCSSDDPLKRARAAAVLCQLRRASATNALAERPDWMFRDETYLLVTKMLENEREPLVLDSAISALGHLDNVEAVSLILRYMDHPDEDLRFSVAFALGCFPNNDDAIKGLLVLAVDPDEDVRDWAVFGLGVQGNVDSPEIRETLFRSLADANVNVREEAAVGLAKRHDQRIIPALLGMLNEPELKVRVAEAAAALLELDEDPPEWGAPEYKGALISKFGEPT